MYLHVHITGIILFLLVIFRVNINTTVPSSAVFTTRIWLNRSSLLCRWAPPTKLFSFFQQMSLHSTHLYQVKIAGGSHFMWQSVNYLCDYCRTLVRDTQRKWNFGKPIRNRFCKAVHTVLSALFGKLPLARSCMPPWLSIRIGPAKSTCVDSIIFSVVNWITE